MTKLNHNRPSLTKQDLWTKHDSYTSFAKRQQQAALNVNNTNKPRSVKALNESGKLAQALKAYQGSDSRLLVIRDKRRYGEPLSSKEQGWASERFQFLTRVECCKAKLLQAEADGNASSITVNDLAVLNDPKLTYPQLAAIERRLTGDGNASDSSA